MNRIRTRILIALCLTTLSTAAQYNKLNVNGTDRAYPVPSPGAFSGQFPEVVSIFIFGQFKCSGSIISSHFVLTAASCFWNWDGSSCVSRPEVLADATAVTIRAGSVFHEFGGDTYSVTKITFNPDVSLHMTATTFQHDLALLKVEKEFQFSFSCQPITVSTRYLPRGQLFTLPGWGATKQDPTVPQLDLGYLKTYALSKSACKSQYIFGPRPYVLPKDTFCTSINERGQHIGYCMYDVGAGLRYVNNKREAILVGVASRLDTALTPEVTCPPYLPNLYTSVRKYVHWIQEITGPRGVRFEHND